MPTSKLVDNLLKIKLLMIAVATGKDRINDVDGQFVELRSLISSQLTAAHIPDPNPFRSLWDWFNYWKSEGMSSYQDRRNFVNRLYAPVFDALEAQQQRPETSTKAFSERHGYIPPVAEAEITIREEAPEELRRVVVDTAVQHGWDYDALLDVASRLGKKPWELPEAHESRVSSRVQLAHLIAAWPWYSVYDFIESIIGLMTHWGSHDDFVATLNTYFQHAGIGWQLLADQIVTRGSEAFETAVHQALPVLEAAILPTSKDEIHKALSALSNRPQADLTGAVQHGIAALECTARAVSGDQRATLGDIIKRYPGLIPKPLDIAVDKVWGYASEMGRHLQEGRGPERAEVELVVGIAATVSTYLAKKSGRQG